MQRFVVGPDICGLTLTKGAVMYLASISMSSTSPKDVVENRLVQSWYKLFTDRYGLVQTKHIPYRTKKFDKLPFKAELEIPLYSCIRGMLLPYLDLLEGDYSELYKRNGYHTIAICEVPDGISCHISADSETGSEFVEENRRYFSANANDSWVKAKAQIDTMLKHYEFKKGESDLDSFRYKDCLFVMGKKYGVVKFGCQTNPNTPDILRPSYVLLKCVSYYNRPDCYEIVDTMNNDYIWHTVNWAYHDQDDMDEIVRIYSMARGTEF